MDPTPWAPSGPGRITQVPTRLIGLDGDDTLWHSESHFITTTERLEELLAPYLGEHLDEAGHRDAQAHLIEVERRNLARFGYGVKAFTLSMIETAVEVSGARVTASEVQQILDWSKEMLDHPVELIEGVADTVGDLSEAHDLMLITKGDLLHQESKIARSGLADRFRSIHIVSEKDPATYRKVLSEHDVAPEEFLMVGNSVRSDVIPVVELGARAVHVPYHTTWALEIVEGGLPHGATQLQSLMELPTLLADTAGD